MSGVGLNHFLIIVKCTRITTEVALHPNASDVIILLYMMPDDFTCQCENAHGQWVHFTFFSLVKVYMFSGMHQC
jgi:hypothetical protein